MNTYILKIKHKTITASTNQVPRHYIDQLTVATNNDHAYLCFHQRKLGHMFFLFSTTTLHSGLELQN